MEFGEWVLNKRKEQKLDIQSFANKTGVNVGTISRIENNHTQPTLYTAFRLVEGLGITLLVFLGELNEQYKDLGEQSIQSDSDKINHESSVLTLLDVENMVTDFSSRGSNVRLYLADTLNKLYKFAENVSRTKSYSRLREEEIYVSADDKFFAQRDIDKLLSSSSFYRFEIKYPARMRSATIKAVYDLEGVIINNDIGPLMRELGLQSSKLSKSSNNFLGRIGLGSSSFDRIKLSEILSMDKELSLDGKLIGVFWEICKFDEKFNTPMPTLTQEGNGIFVQGPLFDIDIEEDELLLSNRTRRYVRHKVATLYIIVYRWYQYMNDIHHPIHFEKYA